MVCLACFMLLAEYAINLLFYKDLGVLCLLNTSLLYVRSSKCDTSDCRQEEVLTNENCTRIVGKVRYQDSLSSVFERTPPVTIYGRLIFENQTAKDLSAIANLTVIGTKSPAVTIKNNENLKDVSGLLTMNLSGVKPLLRIEGNEKICAPLETRRRIRELAQSEVKFDSSCLSSCEGGEIDREFLRELEEVKDCSVINGDLVIKGFTENTSALAALNKIELIRDGALVVQHNAGFESIWFMENLEEISHPKSEEPALQIANNFGLKSVGLKSLKTVQAADLDNAIEIYTFDDVPDSDKKRFESISQRREVFRVGTKDIKELRRVMEPYQYNAAWGVALIAGLAVLMAVVPGLILLTLFRKGCDREEPEEASLL